MTLERSILQRRLGSGPQSHRLLLLALVLVFSGCSAEGGGVGEEPSEEAREEAEGEQPSEQAAEVAIELWSRPPGAEVYFIPEAAFDSAVLNSPSVLSRWRVSEGPTDVQTWQRERSYAVLFVLDDSVRLLRDVRAVFGRGNRVGVEFSIADSIQ